jgi:putative thioredoxin
MTKPAPTKAEAAAAAAAPKGKVELAGKAAVPPSDPVVDSYRRKLSMALF